MATKKDATIPTATGMRRCIGSATFGIEAHEAPVADFPTQPSQKDGLGRMCKPHWREYTNALRKAALARKASEGLPVGSAVEANAARQANRARKARQELGTEAPAIEEARALLAATEKLSGEAYNDAVGTDEVQHALRVLADAANGSVTRAMPETPLGETIDAGTEEADAA